jgi:hypothetical protein
MGRVLDLTSKVSMIPLMPHEAQGWGISSHASIIGFSSVCSSPGLRPLPIMKLQAAKYYALMASLDRRVSTTCLSELYRIAPHDRTQPDAKGNTNISLYTEG